MSSNKHFSLKNILTVGFISLLLGLLAFSISLWQTPRYKSTVKLLAVFNQTNIDTYTASKTANYITGILGEVIYSDTFIDSVYKSDTNLVSSLSANPEQRQKDWKKIIKSKILDNKGIVTIDVFGNDRYQTNLLATNIGYTIISQHGLYDGSADRVSLKMIDVPSIFESWSTTKIISDGLIGLLAGLLLGLTLVIIFPNHRLFELKKKTVQSFPFNNYQPRPTTQPATTAAEPVATITIPTRIESMPEKIMETVAETNSTKTTTNPWLEQYYEENLPNTQD